MAIVIEHGELFSPAPTGKADLLVIGDYIQKVGAINRDALLKPEVETQSVPTSD